MGEDKGTFMSPLRSQEQQVCRRIKKKEKQNFWNKNKIKASSGVGWPAGATLPSPPPPKLWISPTGIYWSPQLILKKKYQNFFLFAKPARAFATVFCFPSLHSFISLLVCYIVMFSVGQEITYFIFTTFR